jgi:hypothetical protein
MYAEKAFPWNRVVDECFVRPIEARLCKNNYGDEKEQNQIIIPVTFEGLHI